MRTSRGWISIPAVALLLMLSAPVAAEDLGWKVPPGFRVTLYADHDLANDIYAMTLDSKGRVVVTSQGYIKVLHDTKVQGKADKATLFAETRTGGMGLCFDGNDLYFCGDGWFSRYRDPAGKGVAEGPPERIAPFHFGEHGGHAMRKGPDGWWYIIGGNDSGITRKHITVPNSPVQAPEAGALLRYSPDCKQSEIIAHGFRNPYDFDFNEAGDLFTYDSDCERDFFLPWYTPTRLYHIGYGGHHGWRLNGYMRAWCRQDFYLDTVDILWPVGRGSPTGVVCYRHDQFPEHYRGGIFALDWTFGKVYFFPLEPDGASYRTKPEVFLEPIGTQGFAPTDVAVAPDGSLFLSIGGRRTRGAVYHIEYVGDGKTPVKRSPAPTTILEAVLQAPQPLDAWSRALWVPAALQLGPAPFAQAVNDERQKPAARIRAIEVLTELFGGLPKQTVEDGFKANKPEIVQARLVWSLGRARTYRDAVLVCWFNLGYLSPRIRFAAFEALADCLKELDSGLFPTVRDSLVLYHFASPDKRVRQAAARLATLLPETTWKELESKLSEAGLQSQLTGALAALWRDPPQEINEKVISSVLSVLQRTKNADLRLQVLRLIVMALGDYHLKDPPVEVYTAYSVQLSLQRHQALVSQLLKEIRPIFPSGDERLDLEASRLLAMLEDDDPETVRKVACFFTKTSSPTRDMHYLVVLARLRGPRDESLTPLVAQTIVGLDRKLEGQEQRNKQCWSTRLAEVLTDLRRRDPRLVNELLHDPAFIQPAHVALAASLEGDQRLRAARLFLTAVRKDPDFTWSGPLIDLLMLLQPEEVRPVLRAHWSELGLRDDILLRLVDKPEAVDRDKFLVGLESSQKQVVRACLDCLERLPPDPEPKNLVPVLRLLRGLLLEPKEIAMRTRLLALLVRQSGQPFTVKEEGTEPSALKRVYQLVFTWFERTHPELVTALNGDDEDPAVWNKLLQAVDWSKGDAARGEAIFKVRSCVTCHSGPGKLGPDLNGVASRFSRDDLFTAIIYPSRDVAPLYRTTVIETREGQTYSGIVAFESADGVILQTGATTTVRLAAADIASRVPGTRSLMPNGLLKDLKPDDLADLYRYLQTLKPAK